LESSFENIFGFWFLENWFVVKKGGVLKQKCLLGVLKGIWKYYLFEIRSHWRPVGTLFVMLRVILVIWI
jgi:hypothetical protein